MSRGLNHAHLGDSSNPNPNPNLFAETAGYKGSKAALT